MFDKEKSNIFTEDFANGKIDTIIEVASFLGVRQQWSFSLNKILMRGDVRGQKKQEHNHTA